MHLKKYDKVVDYEVAIFGHIVKIFILDVNGK